MLYKKLALEKVVAGLLVFALSAPLFPMVAVAQTVAGTGSRGGSSLDSLVQDTTGAIAGAAIACAQNQIHNGIKDLFSSTASTVASGAASAAGGGTADQQVHFAASDPTNRNIQAIANATEAETKKTTCTNAIARAAAGVILRQLTISTVNWINNGFNGNPFYSTDTGANLRSVRDTAIKTLNATIGLDGKNYPFGRLVAQEIAREIGSSFEAQARYSLDQVIAQQFPTYGAADFQRDFSIGGWDAFLAQTAFQNNPFGFSMTTRDVISSRIQGTTYSPAQDLKDQLARSGGFFDQKVCADPNYDKDADSQSADNAAAIAAERAAATNAANAEAAEELYTARASGNQVAIQAAQARLNAYDALSAQANAELLRAQTASAEANRKSTCMKWVVQTPGSVIAHSLVTSLDIGSNQLINGQDLSTDITAIFNALTNQLINKGLSSLTTADGNSANFADNSNGTKLNNQTPTNVKGLVPNGSWSSQGSNFNVFTDIPSVIRYEDNSQSDSSLATGCGLTDVFNDQGKYCKGDPTLPKGFQQILQEEVDSQKQLITAIYELDYCIPGPHPGAISSIDTNANNFVDNPDLFPESADADTLHKFLSNYGNTVGLGAGIAVGAAIGTAVFPGFGTLVGSVAGLVTGAILTAIGNDRNKINENAYGGFMNSVMGLEFEYTGGGREHLNGHDNTANVVTTLAHRYREAMEMVYAPSSAQVSEAQRAAAKDPNGTLIPGLPASTSTYTDPSNASKPALPNLSITNQKRLLTVETAYSLLGPGSALYDLISLDKTEFNKLQSLVENVRDNEALLENSKAIESQLQRLLVRIGELPDKQGYPGLNGPLDLVPIITLKGSKIMTLTTGQAFIDPGATATDTTDGIISGDIRTVSNVNTIVPGIYTVTYDVTNSLGIAANQVTRSVRVSDPATGNVGQVVPNSAVASAQAGMGVFNSSNISISSTAPVRDYNKDLQAIKNLSNVSLLSEYELSLKQISNTFNQLAPYIHGVDDLNDQQALLDAMRNEASTLIDPKNGAIAQCIKATGPNSPYVKQGGPTGRMLFSFVTGDGTVGHLSPEILAALPPTYSFLPDWHFAQGAGIQLRPKLYFPESNATDYPTEPDYTADEKSRTYLFSKYQGSTMSPAGDLGTETQGPVTLDYNKLIRNDDIVTLSFQPIRNALQGLEHIVGMY